MKFTHLAMLSALLAGGMASAQATDAVEGAANDGGWIDVRTETPFKLPVAARSALCSITAFQPLRAQPAAQPTGYVNALWADDAFFAVGTTPVSLQSFGID